VSDLAARIDAIDSDPRQRPLAIHDSRRGECRIVHPERTHAAWWKAVRDDPEQAFDDHRRLWAARGIQLDADGSFAGAASEDAASDRDPSS
jgi:hypothetical protein